MSRYAPLCPAPAFLDLDGPERRPVRGGPTVRALLPLLLGLAACSASDDGASDDTDDTDVGDTDVVDSDTDTDTHTGDTGDTGGGLQVLGCHPLDPVESLGWSRTYDFVEGEAEAVVEVHTPIEDTTVANTVAGTVGVGFGHERSRPWGDETLLWRYWRTCTDPDDGFGGFDIGAELELVGNTIRVGAQTPERVLPTMAELVNGPATFEDSTTLKLRLPTDEGPTCPFWLGTWSRDVTTSVVGSETLDLPALGGEVQAWHLRDAITEALELEPPPRNINCAFVSTQPEPTYSTRLEALGAGTFGFAERVRIVDRWYVQGVGLVKETSSRVVDQDATFEWSRTLTACSGLDGCS